MEMLQDLRREVSEDPTPVAEYGMLVTTFVSALTLALVAANRRGRLPDKIGADDIALLSVATYRLSRTISKDKIGRAIRAPFTEPDTSTGLAEVNERPKGTGLRKAIGQLLSCPFCIGQWVAAAFMCGLVLFPKVTRVLASVFAIKAAQDVLQIAYDATKDAYINS